MKYLFLILILTSCVPVRVEPVTPAPQKSHIPGLPDRRTNFIFFA